MILKILFPLLFFIQVSHQSHSVGHHHKRMIRTKSLETGEYLEMEEVIADDKDECFQFTWVGIAEEGNNTDFQSCTDYEEDVRKHNVVFFNHQIFFSFPHCSSEMFPASLLWSGPTMMTLVSTLLTWRRSSVSARGRGATHSVLAVEECV